jgi:anti-sigma B factor antagonist
MSWEITVVGLEETLDARSAPQVKERFQQVLDRPGPVVLDLRASTLDSTGLGSVLSLQRRLELQERRLVVVSDDPYFHRLLQVTGVNSAICVRRTVEEAIQEARRLRMAPAAA